ncbi:hypothetical protein DPMN_115071 [Dreissena polymorpha]|uniref:Uncharacterized protein n=1 Tax=Dreissena polymorpha TaxID=45954 RepID=A0A9D4KM62_DREPO|nr:hypothetical protein DPMN_115071 [Dreissena polymorpha]
METGMSVSVLVLRVSPSLLSDDWIIGFETQYYRDCAAGNNGHLEEFFWEVDPVHSRFGSITRKTIYAAVLVSSSTSNDLQHMRRDMTMQSK